MFAIIAVDPGQSTGLAEILDEPEIGIQRGLIFQGTPREALVILNSRLQLHHDMGHTVIVACESFRQSGRAMVTPQPEALETSVRVSTIAEARGVRFLSQTPGDAKRVAPNALLQKTGLWVLPREVAQKDANDVNDAMRHCVLAMSRYKATMYDRLLVLAASRKV
jgi:hypothetical protein